MNDLKSPRGGIAAAAGHHYPEPRGRELLIVDPAVEQVQVLLAGLRAGIEVVHLSSTGDALEQIARHLGARAPVAALHVLGHGEPGALRLAGERIDAAALRHAPEDLAAIAEALSDGGRVVLYGCSVGSGAAGRRFVELLEDALGAAVIASETPVGAAVLGGSWDLPDLAPGGRIAFSAAAREVFAGVLAGPTAGDDTLTGTAGADDISGEDGRDRISGLAGDDTLDGGNGNDTMYGDDGLDLLSGGPNNDTMYGGADADTLYGGDGNDFGYAGAGNDFVYGEAGNDGLSGGDSDDSIFGGSGNDTVIGGAGNDVLSGGIGNDWLWGQDGDDILYGGNGNDTVSGNAGDDTLYGGDGDDTMSGAAGSDMLFGGAGNDLFTGSASDFNLDTISDFAVGDSIVVTSADLSALNGEAASGAIDLGSGLELTLAGITAASGTFAASFGGGNTTITLVAAAPDSGGGGSSSDLVVTDTGGDSTGGDRTITNAGSAPASAPVVQNTGNNGNVVTATLPPSVSIHSDGPSTAQSGDAASDTLIDAIDGLDPPGEGGAIGSTQGFLNGLPPNTPLDIRTIVPTLTGGTNTDDPIVFTGSGDPNQVEAFVIDMRSIDGKFLQVDNIEFVSIVGFAHVTGGAGNNYAVGDDNAQFISLGVGDDTLYGGGGADTIGSADGNDLLFGEAGTDTMNGGTGNDTLFGGTEADVAYGNQDGDLLYGNQANDTLYGGQGGDTLFGGQDSDVAYGNLENDVLYGNLGADTLYGGQGDDVLYGGQSSGGVDQLVGGAGNDTLHGGEGADRLSGGDGSDLFVIASGGGADTVTDFDGAGGDRVQITGNANGTVIDTFAELQAAAGGADGGVEIAIGGGNTLTLLGVTAEDLRADWFVFA